MALTPLVTVGIPTYNRPDGLRRTLAYITAQTYPNLEIIVSDNHSADPRVARIVAEFCGHDPRVKYICQPENIGAVHNFFYLANHATGSYFMWAADDDQWDPQFVEIAVNLLEQTRDACVAVPRFEPMLETGSGTKANTRVPDYFGKISELKGLALYPRMLRYIQQKEVFGKAHIIYGLFRTDDLRQAVEKTEKIVSKRTALAEFQQMDVFLNAVALTYGGLVTFESCLRHFAYGPRKSAAKAKRSRLERLLRYDKRTITYFDCYYPLIQDLAISEGERASLRQAVRRRKFYFFLERIGRLLFIYKIYWHFVKKYTFRTVSSYCHPNLS